MKNNPISVDPETIKSKALRVKFNYLSREGLEPDGVTLANLTLRAQDVLSAFDSLLDQDPQEYSVIWLKGLVDDDWYRVFEDLFEKSGKWQKAAYDYASQTTGGDLSVYDLLNLDETFGSGIDPHAFIQEVKDAARDSGLSTLLTKEQTAKILDDCFGSRFPVQAQDIEVLKYLGTADGPC